MVSAACVQLLDEVVSAAKEARSQLDKCEAADELVIDASQRPSTSRLIRQ